MTKKYIPLLILTISISMMVVSADALEFDILGSTKVNGFVSQGYLVSDKNNYLGKSEKGTFEFSEMGINFTSDLSEDILLGIQFFARDLGPTGNDRVKLELAYANYTWRDWLGIRL